MFFSLFDELRRSSHHFSPSFFFPLHSSSSVLYPLKRKRTNELVRTAAVSKDLPRYLNKLVQTIKATEATPIELSDGRKVRKPFMYEGRRYLATLDQLEKDFKKMKEGKREDRERRKMERRLSSAPKSAGAPSGTKGKFRNVVKKTMVSRRAFLPSPPSTRPPPSSPALSPSKGSSPVRRSPARSPPARSPPARSPNKTTNTRVKSKLTR